MGITDRLADLLKSLMGSDDSPAGRGTATGGAGGAGGAGGRPRFADPDVQAAWEELDAYMNPGRERAAGGESSRTGAGAGPGASAGQGAGRRPSGPDESLRRDYANLEVPFGADMETVRRSYKFLVLRYHPDRNAGDPAKQKAALEITKRINESFDRIRAWHEKARTGA